jgi:hypothetical protein
MTKSDILIVVKTYPEISHKYTETVCTAGILSETRSLIRLYPIRFRYLEGDMQFRKYQWIKAEISKASSDSRPESYNIDPNSIEIGTTIPVGDAWGERCEWLLNEKTIFRSVEALRSKQAVNGTSLGIVKPRSINRVFFKNRTEEEVSYATAKKNIVIRQLDFFEEKKDLYILPVRIMVEFTCNDPTCIGHKMSILDWEFGQLFRKVRRSPDWEEKIRAKITDEICGENRDTHIVLGNMASHPQTFCVLGFFWPPKRKFRQIPIFS